MRFNTNVLRLVSCLYIIGVLSYTPTVLYLPALTFSQVTGFGVYTITIIVSLICVVYTCIGGFKAVIWTDALQFAVMIGSMLAVVIIGIISAGGFSMVWKEAINGQRLDIFDFSFDPTLRDSFWSTFIGNFFFLISITSANQSSMQKYLALSDFKKVKNCMIIHFTGIVIIKLITAATGIVAYANYAHCDPFLSNKITKPDQLMPYFVMDTTRNLPGLPGLYIAGIFCAALSTLSTSLNTTSACIYQDIILPFLSRDITEECRTKILKVIVVVLGTVSVLLVIVIEQVGGIFAFSTLIQGISGGPLLGILLLGILFPIATTKGALIGGATGLTFSTWIIAGNLWYKSQGLLRYEEKPASVENCTTSTDSNLKLIEFDKNDVFILYRISFWYYCAISTIMVIISGIIASWFTKKDNVTINSDLLSPVMHRFLTKVEHSDDCVYYDLEKANVLVNSKGSDKITVR
ncbi:hypothetical protein RN001_009142 [Aquatica leii]|uniref:Sodium-coupled monocarboxylate transporter 1 n=1 Tax=Aquatica leii TaxID=1421715 RepID=A0AAN7P883_9COLE|nr:hypothetical protein RN001_009142 [Aquatica leii]